MAPIAARAIRLGFWAGGNRPAVPGCVGMLLTDIRYGVRSLLRWRLGAGVAIVTLTIAIGAATSLYVFLRAALASQTPRIDDLEAVGRIYASSRMLGVERAPLSSIDLQSLLDTAKSFDVIAGYTSTDHAIRLGALTATVSVGHVTEHFFESLRVRPSRGRPLTSDDGRAPEPVVVVTDSFWRKHFADRDPGDATLNIDGTNATVVGVLPPEFGFPFLGITADVWMRMPTNADVTPLQVLVIARLKNGVSWPAASAEVDAHGRARHPDGLWSWRAIPIRDDLDKRAGASALLFLGPAFVVLLIGCVNVSCMLLARGIERHGELNVRCALGATRARIVRQLIAEHLLLATVAGVFGCVLARGILEVISAELAAFQAPFASELSVDTEMLAVALGVTVVASMLFGTLPAIRISKHDVASSLKGVPAHRAGFADYRPIDLVVFIELALAVVLVVVAAMWLALFAELKRITPAFAADQIVAARIAASDRTTSLDATMSVPGVASVALVSSLPGGRAPAVQLQTTSGRVGRAARVEVEPSFFQTIGLPILRGRSFDRSETNAHVNTVVVSQRLASNLWPGENPLEGTVIVRSAAGTSSAVVIGVCADALNLGALATTGVVSPDVYVPFDPDRATESVLLARVRGDAHAFVRPIEAVLNQGGSRPIRATAIADETRFVREESLFLVRLVGAFGLVALGLAATGIFGVLSQAVSQRTTEFAVRMAVGATPGDILLMVIGREAKLIAAAVIAGAAGTFLVTRIVFAELTVVSGRDFRLWIAVAVLCAGFAAAALSLATRRIVYLDPWTALRRL
jgi:putative ABC transport system permease protein